VQQIGRYRIEKELGRGAITTTFEAQDPDGRAVAIRTVHIAALADESDQTEVRRALLQSAKGLRRLEHRHIVPVREVIEERDFVHVVSEFVDARSLRDILTPRESTPPETALRWLQQLAGALDEAHRRGIVHGALWPNNIFVEKPPFGATNAEARLRVADFVVARLVSKYSPHTDPLEEAQRYLAPEQIQEADVTNRADQFALGVLAYQLMTGTKPFEAEHLPTLYYRICKEEPSPAKELVAALSDGTAIALGRALSKSPAQRFSSCLEFVSALAESTELVAPAPEAVAAPAVETRVVPPANLQSEESPAPPLSEAQLSGQRAYLVPEKNWGGRKLALAFLVGILIGAVVWVSRYWKASAPVAVQVADPSHSPSSPPPGPVAKPAGAEQDEGSPATTASTPKPTAVPPASQTPAPSQPKPASREAKSTEDQPRDPKQAAEVRMVSNPVGARVVVDDDESRACVAPCSLQLASGRHTLMATIGGSAAAHRIFTVPADQEVTIVLTRILGTLLVGSSPSGATVLIDGQDRGKTPATIRLPAGQHRLTVVLNGDLRAEQTVMVEGDQIVSRTVRW
jgi:serine/threonine protein kinase